jgi:hypothetical protein
MTLGTKEVEDRAGEASSGGLGWRISWRTWALIGNWQQMIFSKANGLSVEGSQWIGSQWAKKMHGIQSHLFFTYLPVICWASSVILC